MKTGLKFALYCLSLLLLTHAGCDEYLGSTVNCDYCYDIEPDSADLVIDLTFNNDISSVPLVIYNGRIEEDSVEWVDTAYNTPYYLYVAVDRYYSVRAEYTLGEKRIIAIDGDKILSKHVSSDICGYACWVITRGNLDVRLKFTDID
jgi:hypothetical protein